MLFLNKNSLTFNLKKKGVPISCWELYHMEFESNVYAFFAHFQKDSIGVSVRENVEKYQFLVLCNM